jgi:O-antigen ligase
MHAWLFVVSALAVTLIAPLSALAALLLVPLALAGAWQQRLSGGPLAWLMLGWLTGLPVSLLTALSPGLALPQAAVLLCLPLAWLAGTLLDSRNRLDRLLTPTLPVVLAILLIWGLLQGPNTFTLKPQGPFNDPNTYAAALNLLALPLLAHYLAGDPAHAPRGLRTGHLALLAAVAFVAFLVSSRGATLALLLVTPPLFWLARKQPDIVRKLALLASVTLVSYFAAQYVSGGTSVAQRLADTVASGDPSRIMLMRSAWLMIQDHPWVGSGLGSFRLLYPQYRFETESTTAGGWVHNDYLQLWLEGGLPLFLLVAGLALWVGWAAWRTLRADGRDALLRMGYLAAIGAILLHALVNFLFFFSLISTLLGLYLARVSLPVKAAVEAGGAGKTGTDNLRAKRMAIGGYAFALGYLLIGQVAVEVLLGKASVIQRSLYGLGVIYPRYQVAYWVSVLAPFHPTPQQIMGLELADSFLLGGGRDETLRADALQRMEAGWQRAPCYLPYANDALAVIRQETSGIPLTDTLRAAGQKIVARNLECNARHGLSYYHAGGLATNASESMMWWRAGLAASPNLADRLLLATAVLSRTTPGQEKTLAELGAQMAQAIRGMESNPGTHPDQVFWTNAQHKLLRIAGQRMIELVRPPGYKSRLNSTPLLRPE